MEVPAVAQSGIIRACNSSGRLFLLCCTEIGRRWAYFRAHPASAVHPNCNRAMSGAGAASPRIARCLRRFQLGRHSPFRHPQGRCKDDAIASSLADAAAAVSRLSSVTAFSRTVPRALRAAVGLAPWSLFSDTNLHFATGVLCLGTHRHLSTARHIHQPGGDKQNGDFWRHRSALSVVARAPSPAPPDAD